MQCGNNRQRVFLSPLDWRLYLELLARHARRYGTRVLAYCLMPNHLHLLVLPEEEDSLARTLGRTHAEYALALNRAEDRSGHLWENRFRSCPVERAQFYNAARYVELNPVRAGLAAVAWEWPWSSAAAHCDTGERLGDAVLAPQYGGGWNPAEWRGTLLAGMREGECHAVRRATRSGEPLGSEEFVAELERRVGRRLRVLPRGRPRKRAVVPVEVDWKELSAVCTPD